MNTITLAQAIDILTACTAVYVDGSYVTFPNVVTDWDDDEREGDFLRLAVSEGDDEERFADADNAVVTVNPSGEMVLINRKGQTTTIMPLVANPVKA